MSPVPEFWAVGEFLKRNICILVSLCGEVSNRWNRAVWNRGVSHSARLKAERQIISTCFFPGFQGVWAERTHQQGQRSKRDSEGSKHCLFALLSQEIQETITGAGGKSGKWLPLRPSSTGISDLLLLQEASRRPAPISGMTSPVQALNNCYTQQLQPSAAPRY